MIDSFLKKFGRKLVSDHTFVNKINGSSIVSQNGKFIYTRGIKLFRHVIQIATSAGKKKWSSAEFLEFPFLQLAGMTTKLS